MLKVMNKKWFAPLAIVLTVVVVVLIAGGIWYYEANKSLPANSNSPTPPFRITETCSNANQQSFVCAPGYHCVLRHGNSTIQSPAGFLDGSCVPDAASSWKTYTNPQFGFQFQYPTDTSTSDLIPPPYAKPDNRYPLDTVSVGNPNGGVVLSISVFDARGLHNCSNSYFSFDTNTTEIFFAGQQALYTLSRPVFTPGGIRMIPSICVDRQTYPLVISPGTGEWTQEDGDILSTFEFTNID
jgi:hypothetical protein